MVRSTQQKVDQESFNRGWELAFGDKQPTVEELQAKLDRIKARILHIKDSDTALAKTLKVQNLLAMFDDDTGKMK